MKIISWNVNSVMIRYLHILELIDKESPDIILLQETKTKILPFFEGYYSYSSDSINGRNGVAILSKIPLIIKYIIAERLIGCSNDNCTFYSVYVPNGMSVSASISHKINFFHEMMQLIDPQSIIGGDFNVVYKTNETTCPEISYSKIEINALQNFEKHFINTTNPNSLYLTCWDYRFNRFKKNIGLGLDKFYCTKNIQFDNSFILRYYRSLLQPSDHAPIMINIHI